MRPETVWLLGYPVALGLALSEHVEDWVREFRLISIAQEQGAALHEVPARLQATVQHLRTRYAAELSRADQLRAAAAARGEATVDLPYPVLPETEQTVLAWRGLLAEVDSWCASEDLLTLQRPPELVALSDWVCEEFLRQLRGQPPQPWTGRTA